MKKAVEMMKLGARDYLIKDVNFLDFLEPVVKRVIGEIKKEKRLIKVEESLRNSKETTQALLNATQDWAMLIDPKGTIFAINEIAAHGLGKSIKELISKCIFDFFPPDLVKFRKEKASEIMHSCKPVRFEEIHKKNIYDNTIYPVLDKSGKIKQGQV